MWKSKSYIEKRDKMGEKSDVVLMYSIDGNEFREISEIPDLATVAEETNCNNIDLFRHPRELILTGSISTLHLLGIFLDEASFRQYSQSTKSNNWLRRHGLPMRRRMK
jgi:hypothetical protein